MPVRVVSIAYSDLVSFSQETGGKDGGACQANNMIAKIGQAFGHGKLGILQVTGVPTLDEKRRRLLPLARQVALLEDKTQVISESSNYQVGWSHGKEVFADGKPDVAKGSFYANPLYDDITTISKEGLPQDVIDANPGFFAPNVWPTSAVPDLEGAFKELGQLVVDVGRLVAEVCDAYVAHQCPGYEPNKLARLLQESNFCKARLLHYFALDRSNGTANDDFSDWCGWHNDHGSLTGLIPAIFLNPDGSEATTVVDDKAGLYIQDRNGAIHHVSLAPDAIGFQIGETSQIHSGGILQATPHAVRGSQSVGVTRESFAVFMEPEYNGAMDLPAKKTVEDVQDASIQLPSSVKALKSRWKPGMNFGEFSAATFAAFY